MADDFLSAIGVADPSAKAKTYDPTDAAIRTIYGESSGDPDESKAIASVIVNRAKASGKPFDQIVSEPGQFEAWSDPKARKRLDALTPDSADYKAIQANVGDILAGKANPYPDLHQFYAPGAQAALGRDKPGWDDGSGQKIGSTLFFGGAGGAAAPSPDDFLGSIGVDPAKVSAAAPADAQFTGAGITPYSGLEKTGQTLTAPQQKTYEVMAKAQMFGKDDAPGSARNPYFVQDGADPSTLDPGSYYVERGDTKTPNAPARIARVPGGKDDSSFHGDLGGGLGQGLADVPLSLGNMLPGTKDSELRNVLEAHQLIYDADNKGKLVPSIGRFTGQMALSVPLLAGGEAAAAPALATTGVGRFLLGRAGAEMAPGVARLAARAGSIAANSAAQGGAGAALTSSASDEALPEQILHGAEAGAVVGPLVPAARGAGKFAGGLVGDLIKPLTAKGRGEIADKVISNFADGAPVTPNADEIIPGSVPTLAQSTGNPGIATLERTTRLSNPTPFAERDAANAEARVAALDSVRGDHMTVADLADKRRQVLDVARERAFDQAGPADVAPAVSAIDQALAAPEAHMDEVARPLNALREKIVQPPAETTPEQTGAFHRALTQSFGADATSLTPEVMSQARGALGKKFEDIAANTEVPWDDKLRSSIGEIIKNTAQVVPEGSLPPLFKTLDNIASTANDGKTITGASYQALTKRGSPLDSLMKSGDPTIRDAAGQIREALDDGLERSLAATEAPAGAAAGASPLDDLRATRLQYKNLKTVEAALRSAGPDKQVTPQAVMSAVKRNFGQFAYQGGGPLGDAAEAAIREQAARPPTVQTDPRQLHGMREELSNSIDALEKKGTDAGDQGAAHLRNVRDQLDQAIGTGAKGYGDYAALAESSGEPIRATRFLQQLRLTDARGNITLGRVDSALKRITDMRAQPGKNSAKDVSDATLAQLHSIREDLLRADKLNLGRPLGPDTAQHLATANVASRMSVPLALGATLGAHPLVGTALGAGKMFYGMKDKEIQEALVQRLLDPTPPMRDVTPPPKSRLSTSPLSVGAGILSSRLLGK